MPAKPKSPPTQPEPDAHKIGYARVSTADQNPQLQIDALLRAGVDRRDIWTEKVSGAAKERPQLDALMKDIRPGDVVIVWKLDRLGRDAIRLHQTAEAIQAKGAHLRLLDNSGLDTTTAAGRMMFAMLAAMAQFERDLTYERTMAGLATARAHGRVGGQKPLFTDEQVLEAHRLYGVAGGARSLVYQVKGKYRHMSLAGFRKALERAQQEKDDDE
jgi:DNA invertase Pin-like site-specific DNA recombinase